MSKKKTYLNTLLLSGYASIALLVGVLYRILMYEQTALVNRNFLKEGIPHLPCDIGVPNPLLWTVLISTSCFVALFAFYSSKKFKKYYSFIIYLPFVAVLFLIIPGIRNSWELGYFATITFVICLGSWLLLEKADEIKSKELSPDALKLMHKEFLQIFQLFIWSTIILVAGLIWNTWVIGRQDLIEVACQPIYTVPPYWKKMTYTAIEILYLTVGIIVLVILQIYLRMADIREKLNEKDLS